MMDIVDPLAMRQREEALFAGAMTADLVVESVGAQAAMVVAALCKKRQIFKVIALAGRGNNAADAVATLRHLVPFGFEVELWHLQSDLPYSKELKQTLEYYRQGQLPERHISCAQAAEAVAALQGARDHLLLLDGLFGIGLARPLDGPTWEPLFTALVPFFVVALDIPSGICGSSGEGTVSVPAKLTLAIGAYKWGHFLGVGRQRRGRLRLIPAGIPTDKGSSGQLIAPQEQIHRRRQLNPLDYKNRYGHLLVVGGSPGLTGAPILSALAALRAGAGLVTLATPAPTYPELIQRLPPSVMAHPLPLSQSGLADFLRSFDTICIGPGATQRDAPYLKPLFTYLLSSPQEQRPLLIDAGALEFFMELIPSYPNHHRPIILTPHWGEWLRLSGEPAGGTTPELAKRLAREYQIHLVLKNATSLIATPEGELFVWDRPNPLLAVAGSGDILAGLLATGLMEHHMGHPLQPTDQSWILSEILHAFSLQTLAATKSRDTMKRRRGVLPTELIECLGLD